MFGRLFVIGACLTACALPAATSARPYTWNDFSTTVRVSDPQISPDGARIVYVLSHVDMVKDKSKSQLVVVSTADPQRRHVLTSRDGASSPQWSPDGSQIAFVAASGEGDKTKPQVFLLPMDGGDADVVTSAPNGIESYSWRPDGKALAYVTADDAKNKADIAKHRDLFTVGDQDFLSQKAPVASHIWLQPLPAGKARRLSSEAALSVNGSDLSWSHDGKYIAFAHLPDSYGGHIGHQHAAYVDFATGIEHELLPGNAYSANPQFSPTQDSVAYSAGVDNLWAFQNDLVLSSLDGHNARRLATSLDRDISFAQWMPQGTGMLIGAADHTAIGMWRIADASGARPQRVDLGEVNFGRQASIAKNGAIAFTGSTPRDPSEVYYIAAGANAPQRLTDYNATLSALDLASTREFLWSNEGFTEDGALTYPAGYTKGHKYPLVLVIHGGPTTASSTTSFSALNQILASHGYFVLQPNYRGSDNLGFAYAKALRGDVDAGPGRDIVAGVKALEATGDIDASRIGVSGWSGGGLLTSWLVGHYTLWKAAVSGAAVNDFVEEYDLSDVFDYMPALMGDISPWVGGGYEKYRAASPITYAANVSTPLLILSDTGDYRVPTVQSYAFYRALRENGKDVTFVAIPAYGHFPSDPVRQLETYKRWAAWMDSHFGYTGK